MKFTVILALLSIATAAAIPEGSDLEKRGKFRKLFDKAKEGAKNVLTAVGVTTVADEALGGSE